MKRCLGQEMRESTLNKIFYYVILIVTALMSLLLLGISLWNLVLPAEFCWMQPKSAINCVLIGGAFSFIVGMVLGRE